MGTETFTGNTVIIDLGLDRGEPETYRSPTRSTVSAWFGPLVVVLLVLISSVASASPPRPPLSEVFSLRLGSTDTYAVTDDGRLLTQAGGTLSLYDLGTGTRQWSSGSSAPAYRLRTGDGLVLMRPWSAGLSGVGDPGTTAISLRSGAAQWRRAGSVVTLAGSAALFAVTGVRSLSGTGRRVQGSVDRVDPVTGSTRWKVAVPSTAVLLTVPGPAGAPPRVLLVHDNRTAAVHDIATGALLTTGPLPPADYGPDNPAVSGGLILLRHPGEHGPEISAYDPVTLGLRWSKPGGDTEAIVPCGPYACLTGASGVRAVDPATGATKWYRAAWRTVAQFGDRLLAYSSPAGSSELLGVIDPVAGRVATELPGWRPLSGATTGTAMVLTRVVDAGARSMVAVARPGSAQPRLIAELPPGSGDCQTAPGRLVCRSVTGELIVWSYEVKG
jgi:outer membrane protein assembly factor BamB